MSTTPDATSAASPALAYAFVIGLTAASWYGLWRYARPAIQSQAGRPTRMTRDRRLRTIAFSVLVMIYPLMFTAGCVMMAFQPTGDAGIWTANLMIWAMTAALITAPFLGLLALIFRTIDRHHARVQRRSLGLPDPPAPWWPSAVAATWSVIIVGGSIAVGYLTWQLFNAYAQRRSALLQSQWQIAMNDPSVQQLVARGASRATIEDHLITLTGTGSDVAELKNNIQIFLVGNIVAFFVIIAVAIGGAVLLCRRQKRRIAHYECSDHRLRKPSRTTGDLGTPGTQTRAGYWSPAHRAAVRPNHLVIPIAVAQASDLSNVPPTPISTTGDHQRVARRAYMATASHVGGRSRATGIPGVMP